MIIINLSVTTKFIVRLQYIIHKEMARAEGYDTFLFDCDGVVWRGSNPVPGASETLKHLISLNKTVIFVTNNTSKTRTRYRTRFKEVLDLDVSENQIYSAGITAALYVKQKLKLGEKIFLIGSQGLSEIMDETDVEYIGHECVMEGSYFTDFLDFVPDGCVKYVVGALDGYFNYSKMAKAFIYIKECGAEYIATNLDMNHCLNSCRMLPGTGAVLEGLSQSLGMQPKVLGKPSSLMFDMICSDHKIENKSRVLMVGDTMQSDVQFGINSGIDTALVLSGITSKDTLLEETSIRPTFVIDSISDLLK